LLSSILRQKKIQSSFAGSLAEADKMLKENSPPHIIFLDNYLPDGLGINHIHTLKKKYPSSKIVMITAHDNVSDRLKAQHEGADFFYRETIFPGKLFLKQLRKQVRNNWKSVKFFLHFQEIARCYKKRTPLAGLAGHFYFSIVI
jgi:DNA-binding response OmpR family regulator